MVKNNYRTAAEGEHAAAAPRRRRRILQAGFFLLYRKVLRQKDINGSAEDTFYAVPGGGICRYAAHGARSG